MNGVYIIWSPKTGPTGGAGGGVVPGHCWGSGDEVEGVWAGKALPRGTPDQLTAEGWGPSGGAGCLLCEPSAVSVSYSASVLASVGI